jgi:general secretion pathway protein G
MNGARYLNVDKVPADPWGREYLYDPPGEDQKRPRVYTLGADGKVGGAGEDADVDSWTMRDGPR